jgi:esterase/lipase superfamily enzyme
MPGFDRAGTVVRYGHYGRPVLVFPAEQCRAWDFESNGVVDAVGELVEARRIKLYCLDSVDDRTWSDTGISLELDEWGHDSAHDWEWWQKQLAHHLPRFCEETR